MKKIHKNIKIAVCISGLVRHWDISTKLFEHWNSLYEDIEFYFFLSTWDEGCNWLGYHAHIGENNIEKKIEKNDYSQYSFLEKYEEVDYRRMDTEILLEMDNNPTDNKTGKPNYSLPFYTYSMYRCQRLRRKYEQENNMEFDGVIQTRNDQLVSKVTLDSIRSLFYDVHILIHPKLFSGGSPIVVYRDRLLMWNDNFSFAHRLSMDLYTEMYNDIFVQKTSQNLGMHYQNADQLMKNRIYNNPLYIHNWFIRDSKTTFEKSGSPTESQLINLIETKGVDFFFEHAHPTTNVLGNEYFK